MPDKLGVMVDDRPVLFEMVELIVLFTAVMLLAVELILVDMLAVTFDVVTLELIFVTLLDSLTQCNKDFSTVMLLQCLVRFTKLLLHRSVTFC